MRQGLPAASVGESGPVRRLASIVAERGDGKDRASELPLGVADIRALPFGDQLFDMVWCRLVIGYIADLAGAYQELGRVTRPGGSVIVTDFHPAAARAGLVRSFRDAEGVVHVLENHVHEPAQHQDAAARAGLAFDVGLDQVVGPVVRPFYDAARMLDRYEQQRGLPLVLALRFPPEIPLADSGCPCVAVEGNHFVEPRGPFDRIVDLGPGELRPGLINAHDHLYRNHFPRLGSPPYPNAYAWAEDLQARCGDTIAPMSVIPRRDALLFGALKNLVAGVTTVIHHDRWQTEFCDNFPVRVAHVRVAHSLRFESDLAALGCGNGAPPDAPFCIHLAEGTDAQSAVEIAEANRLGLFAEPLIPVHPVGVAASGIEVLRRARVPFVWCSSSYFFLCGRSAPRSWWPPVFPCFWEATRCSPLRAPCSTSCESRAPSGTWPMVRLRTRWDGLRRDPWGLQRLRSSPPARRILSSLPVHYSMRMLATSRSCWSAVSPGSGIGDLPASSSNVVCPPRPSSWAGWRNWSWSPWGPWHGECALSRPSASGSSTTDQQRGAAGRFELRRGPGRPTSIRRLARGSSAATRMCWRRSGNHGSFHPEHAAKTQGGLATTPVH